jgi:hypothetical protein
MRKQPWAGRLRWGGCAFTARIALATLGLLLTGACEQFAQPMPWGVDTVYEIDDIDAGAQRRLARALDRNGFGFEIVDGSIDAFDPDGATVRGGEALDAAAPVGETYGADEIPAAFGRRGGGSMFRFRLSNVRSMRDLRHVQMLIQQVSEGSRVPVVLQDATMRFSSVSGRGSARIWVSGSATPGAEVLLDVGQGEVVRGIVDERGDWTAAVERTSRLRERRGWIYALIRKGRAKQYLRMNVLDVANTERLLYDELPPDCVLRRY